MPHMANTFGRPHHRPHPDRRSDIHGKFRPRIDIFKRRHRTRRGLLAVVDGKHRR
nr:MAG TPA: hypothetical protein [Caudoviricetes sp.]